MSNQAPLILAELDEFAETNPTRIEWEVIVSDGRTNEGACFIV